MEKLRVGIIGTGFHIGISRRHVEAYRSNPRVSLRALYDIVPGRSAEWVKGKDVGDVVLCDTLEQLFGLVDAVSICTPNNTHPELVVRALRAGKHVLCEKPFAPTCADAACAVEEAARHPDLTAMICFNYREIPAIRYMKSVIDAGRIGKVFTMRQKLGGARMAASEGVGLEWRMQRSLSGTGALADFGCHMLDLADYLLTPTQGKMCEVNCLTGTFIRERIRVDSPDSKGPVTNDDAAVFSARTENGALYTFTASRVSRPGHYFEISGEGGILVYDSTAYGDAKVEVQLKDKAGAYKPGTRQIVDVPAQMLGEENHKGIVNAFVRAVLDKTPDDRTLERGLYIQHIIDTAQKSSEEKRTILL